jgi:hypothetical protein
MKRKGKSSNSHSTLFELMGNAILLASIQASIGSVEMSSKFSVVNFSKDQRTLQAAADALTGYLMIGIVWMIGSVLISYGEYGCRGLVASLIANAVIMGWIVLSYLQAFQIAAKTYGLQYPRLFRFSSTSESTF